MEPKFEQEAQQYLLAHYQAYEKLGRLMMQFMAWKFLDHFDQGSLPILQNAEYRVKSFKSIRLNVEAGTYDRLKVIQLNSETEKYEWVPLSEAAQIPDLVGARIIAYFEDDLYEFVTSERIFELFGSTAQATLELFGGIGSGIKSEGYKSWHFEAVAGEECLFWSSLRDYDRKALYGLKCENQIRTVIQHAFGETNHELNYKYKLYTKSELPDDVQESWRSAGETLQNVDTVILDLKSAWGKHDSFKAKKMEHKPTYKPPVYDSSSWNWSGFKFHYKVLYLHEVGATLPNVLVFDNLFNINEKMEAIGGEGNYKNRMWKHLEQTKPEEISKVDYDSMVPRVCGWDESTKSITVQPAFYSDQAVSNHQWALDEKVFGIDKKLREIALDDDGQFLTFDQSPLSNTLGAAIVMRTRDGKWVLSHRGAGVAFDAGKLGLSASGAVEWNELGQWGEKSFEDWFGGGIIRELGEELGVDTLADDIRSSIWNRLVFLGFAREQARAGKPQLFFFIDETERDFDDLKEMWRIYADNVVKKQGQLPEFKDICGATTEQVLAIVSGDQDRVINALVELGIGDNVSEETRLNLALAVRYLGLDPR